MTMKPKINKKLIKNIKSIKWFKKLDKKNKRICISSVLACLIAVTIIALNVIQQSFAVSTKLYDQIETDIVTNNYGSTYTGSHSDEFDGTVGNKNIYYYTTTGHNYVKLGNHCWTALRTTDTGGVKLMYEGPYSSTYGCKESTTIQPGSYYEAIKSYETNYTVSEGAHPTYYSWSKNESNGTYTCSVNNSVSWDQCDNSRRQWFIGCTTKTLTSTTCEPAVNGVCTCERRVTEWRKSEDSTVTVNKREPISTSTSKYNTSTNSPKYVGYKFSDESPYNGNSIDSNVKETIDTWYDSNLKTYGDLLEDTTFCNDRSTDSNGTACTSDSSCTYRNNSSVTDLSCPNSKDRFSVINSEAKLDNPIGLPTAAELNLVGTSVASRSYGTYWTMSPDRYESSSAYLSTYNTGGAKESTTATTGRYIYPVVSLTPNIEYTSGTGTNTSPYILDEDTGDRRVTYDAGHGTLTGKKFERLTYGSNPTGRDVTANSGYTFSGWVANKDVTLSNGTILEKGTLMTKKQTKSIAVNKSITLTAQYHKGYLYDKVKEDATTNGYGGTYSGDHADTVENDGTEIVGDKSIYYYTTAGHNNVKLGDLCWQVLRTTDTGGVKLIYNGKYDSTNKCDIGVYAEGEGVSDTLTIASGNTYYYGTSYTLNSETGKYKLSGTTTQYSYSATGKVGKYTCKATSSTTSCDTLTYIDSKKSGTTWNVTTYDPVQGHTIGESKYSNYAFDALYFGYKYKTTNYNDTDGTLKTYIDDWYSNNMTDYTDLLEDVVFCNDRTGASFANTPETGTEWHGSGTSNFFYHSYGGYYSKLSCYDKRDRFTTNNTNAQLTYPVALATYPEMRLLANNSMREVGVNYWLLSPYWDFNSDRRVNYVEATGDIDYILMDNTSYNIGVRPSVSIKPNTTLGGGTGTVSNPYTLGDIVETEYTVTYSAGSNGTLSGTSSETIDKNDNPTGRDVTANNGYKFTGWVANKDVKLSNNITITKGTIMTKTQTKSIVVTSSLTLTAKYYKGWLYDQVEEDITTNNYGSTYTGDHADTVQNDGTAIVGDKNIYYYTTGGHNNIKLGNFCWQIIRTTDTGGIKLVYNGEYSSSTKCNNSGDERTLSSKSEFNSTFNNANYAGYKYKTTNDNDTDSTIKTAIDNWYSSNMTSYTSKLEDTVFCNDRTGSTSSNSAGTGTTWNGEGTSNFYYHGYDSTYNKLSCDNEKDRFTTNNTEAQLTYPVGLVTYPESLLLDGTTKSLGNSSVWWLISPHMYSGDSVYVRTLNNAGNPSRSGPDYKYRVRPAISLKSNITFENGTGSLSDPYVAGDIVEPTEFTVTYSAGSKGALSGTSSEVIEKNSNPTGRDVTASSGYTFKGWVANKDVKLSNNITITKGTIMTKTQTKSIVVTSSLTLTAKYYKGWLYDQVAEDITTNNYGSTYTGDHADTVQNDGTTIVGNKNIYYYNVAGHNNVKLGDFCWQIIRTTDTGGIKLVYNGTYDASTKCNNSGEYQSIVNQRVQFNSTTGQSRYVGYKYKTTDWNDTDSTIKSYIETWYENNMTDYTDLLEDTVFCNDRTGNTTGTNSELGTEWCGEGSTRYYYHNFNASSYNKLSCDNVKDRFTTNNTSAQLTYPVGLMSAPEYYLGQPSSGINIHYTGREYWTISPAVSGPSVSSVNRTYYDGQNGVLTYTDVGTAYDIRPSISLKSNITFEDGTGTASDPYEVGSIVNYLSGSVTITGNNAYGSTLTVTVTNTDGADLAYQWYYTDTPGATSGGTPITGATSSTYTLTGDLVGKYIYVVVEATKTGYTDTTWTDATDGTNNGTAAVAKDTFTPSITQTVPSEKPVYKVGDTITYNITVTNNKSYAISNVVVEDPKATITSGTGYTVNNDHKATIASIAAGSSVTITATYTVTDSEVGTYANTATITGATATNADLDGTPSNSKTVNIQSIIKIESKVKGNTASTNKYFKVQVIIGGTTGDTYTISGQDSSVNYNGTTITPSTTYTVGSTNYVYLKHGQTVTIGNGSNDDRIAPGIIYKIVEDTNDYYTYINGSSTNSKDSGNLTVSSSSSTNIVDLVNRTDESVPTGIITKLLPYLVIITILVISVVLIIKEKLNRRRSKK